MKDKNQRDKELDEMLAPFRKLEPKASHMHSWQEAVESARSKRRFSLFTWQMASIPQLAAAILVGFFLGILFIKNSQAPLNSFVAKKIEPSATIEEIYAKSD